MFDPLGPGTPAWEQFDKACAAWQKYAALPRGHHDRRRANKAYFNHRAMLHFHVTKHGGTWADWETALKAQRNDVYEMYR